MLSMNPRLMLALSMGIFGTLGPFVRNISVSSGELALYRAIMAAICPGFEGTEELIGCIIKMAEAIDFKNHSSIYAPLLLSCAYFLCKTKK